jgi:hypothetical protein
MYPGALLDPAQGAEETLGGVDLQDQRRTRRAVQVSKGMARDPAASLPKPQQTWSAIKALCRLLGRPAGTVEALIDPQWQQKRADLAGRAVVLLVQETTELDLTRTPA